MTNSNESDRDRLRAAIDQIVERLKSDTSFAEQVRAEPRTALARAGLSEDVVTAFMREVSSSDDVSAYGLQAPNFGTWLSQFCP